jgi:tRNA threonylcarbamoyladenosine biosynthesis protein TsaB
VPASSQQLTGWTVAIETVATAGSVALLRHDNYGEELAAEMILPADTRSAKTLAAAIQKIWHEAGKPPIELVAVANGPGSFTGLRVGVITAKTLAYAWQSQLLGVNTLDAIAAQVPVENTASGKLHVVLEAQRQELFIATFQAVFHGGESGRWERTGPDAIISTSDWLTNLQHEQVAGPALKKLREKLPSTVTAAADNLCHPHAATVARLGRERQQAGAADELWTLLPHYLRVSYAEEGKKTPT